MSSDSEHIPKPSKRVRCRISDSESGDDSSPVRISRKRRTNKFDSDDSSEEDSDVQMPGRPRRHRRPILGDVIDDSSSESGCSSQIVDDGSTDTEWESDWDSIEETDDDETLLEKPRTSKQRKKKEKTPVKSPRHSESDDSDGQTEKCPICLLAFREQEVGTPSACDHCFCLLCLTEWSKNVNTCPVDRQEFMSINVREQLGGQIIRQIPVESRDKSENELENDATYCQVCEQCDREERMLLCDGCDLGYHMECLNPPMHQVPIEEWFCPRCSSNNQNLAESIEIDLDEVPDLMAEARLLGVTYGRTRTGVAQQQELRGRFEHVHQQRLVPRTRQTERVRANIRAGRTRAREVPQTTRVFDPDQPSTSSGFDSISENSRGRSPYNRPPAAPRSRRTANAKSKRSKATSRKTRSKKSKSDGDIILQEVRIKEYNADGVEEEIVTYVKVKQKASRKHKKRAIKMRKKRKRKSGRRSRYCRINTKTVKNRLALSLGLVRRPIGVSLSGPNVNNQISVPSRSELSNARYRAGISQVNLFGDNLMLDYVPMGSDDEVDGENGDETGSAVGVQRRNAPIRTNRRRLALKAGVSCPQRRDEPSPIVDLLSSIISSQELWHSKESKKNITLKADGTLLLPNEVKNDEENNVEKDKSILENKNEVPSSGNSSTTDPEIQNVLGSTTINSSDIIQAPMYNSSRAGGVGNNNADNGGSFRGNYHDRGNYHGHGGQDYSYPGGGRPNYGGPGPRGGFGHGDIRPPLDFSPNFENRRRPPLPGMPHFRNRPHQNYRDNRRGRFNMDRGPFRPVNMSQGPVFPHPTNFQGSGNMNNHPMLPNPRLHLPHAHVQPGIHPEINPSVSMPEVDAVRDSSITDELVPDEPAVDELVPDEPAVVPQSERVDGEECDIYSDIQTPNKPADETEACNSDNKKAGEDQGESVVALLPPPVPPSDLLDYDEKSDKENESDGEDLVIDDTPKDGANAEETENKTEDKYDPFSVADSDSNDSHPCETKKTKEKDDKVNEDITVNSNVNDNPSPPPLAPPPTPPDFPLFTDNAREDHDEAMNSLTRLGAYDEDEDDSQDDCPNFSIYSSETMDVARHTEQELSQQIGPLEPPPMPPDIPDDDDIIVADVQACDLSDIPEPVDPYVASLQKERQTLSKIPSKKISIDHIDGRGKITFKIGNKSKLNNRFNSLYDELDDNVEVTLAQEKPESKEKQQANASSAAAAESVLKQDKAEDEAEKDDSGVKVDDPIFTNADEKTKDVENDKQDEECQSITGEEPAIESISDETSRDSVNSVQEIPLDDEESLPPSKADESLPKTAADSAEDSSNVEQHDEELDLSHTPESTSKADFVLEKERTSRPSSSADNKQANADDWESDGAYTPCKDEMPVKEKSESTRRSDAVSPFESGLEPITPPAKDRSSDDLDGRCPTPIEYAGLGTEAISETDEAINFEEELALLSLRKEKEMEDGEITDENRLSSKKQSEKSSDTEDANNRKRKKEKRKQVAEKNKENISSDNQVAWKKISKNTKDRQYREKGKRFDSREKDKESGDKARDKSKYREKSKEKTKKKVKDGNDKKKEKRKELPRYDVRKIVAEKPARPRKDEYGRDIRDLSRSMSRSRSLVRTNKRSHSRELRLSRSYSPRINSRSSRSWSRRLARSWSRNRQSPLHKRSVSRSRRKSAARDRRSLSRRRSRSPLNRRSRRSLSNQRQRRNQRRSISRKHRSRSRSWSRSRSRSKAARSRSRSRTRSRSRDGRAKEKSKKHKSRSRSKRRKRSRSKSPISRKAQSKSRSKKRTKRKLTLSVSNNSHSVVARSRSRERSYSRDRNRSRNWNKVNDKTIERSSFGARGDREAAVSGNASWSAQWTPSWSRSRSRTPPITNRQHNDHLMGSHDWSPSPSSLAALAAPSASALAPSSPPSQSSVGLVPANSSGMIGGGETIDNVASPKNLTVILRNKDAIKSKKRREKRAKDRKKSRETERRKTNNKRNRTPPPSKEVFASGDNILVSVCFNNENATGQTSNSAPHLTDTIPLLTATKRRHREPIPAEPSKKPKKDKSKDKRSKSPNKTNRRDKKRKSKAAEIAATKKPVAVIDLDQSPFREQTPSPRDVIVLSDDDQDDDDHNNNHSNIINNSSEANNNSGNVSVSNTTNSNANNNDGNVNNKSINLDDDDDEEETDNIRVQEQQRRLSSSVQQHMQQQLQLQLQAEQQGGKTQNQEEGKDMQHQDQLTKLHLQQRCSIVSEHDFIAQGPKTPPEPQVKFSINKQPSNLRPAMLHPLFDGDDDEEIEGDDGSNAGNNVEDDDKCGNERQATSGEGASNKLTTKDAQGEAGEEDEDEGMEEEDDVDNDDIDDEEEEEAEGGRSEQDKQSLEKEGISAEDHLKIRLLEDLESGKIGPNTPPEPPSSPMTSPDAYDPFDPTKSRSPTPNTLEEPLSNDQKHCDNAGASLTSMKESGNEKQDSDKPKVISMVTIKHAPSPGKDANLSAGGDSSKIMDNSSKDQISIVSNVNSYATINPVLATVAAAVQRSGMFSVSNSSGFNVQRNLSQTNHISPSNQLKQRANDRTPQLSNLFLSSVKNLPMSRVAKSNRNSSMLGQNGNDLPLETINDTTTIDTSSPYSPGSSLSDGIFDPPSPGRNHHSPSRPSNVLSNNMKNSGSSGNASKIVRGSNDKKDAFDSLFGSSPTKSGGNSKPRMKKTTEKRKKASNSKIGVRMDENQLQILDDLPSSAVEMQVKDKFLKKLNRQERVVEEVKLVLKPHYTKKHITKEEYKDIMRKAVPKICHNRTGEINPKKIAQLVEAYVKRCRSNKRKGGSGGVTNAGAKPSRPQKNPWS